MTTAVETKPSAASHESRIDRERARLLDSTLDRINFGCGGKPLSGWVNIDGGDGAWYDAPGREDVIALDIFDALDVIPDGVASCVYSEHLFEHFTLHQGHALLAEWARILKPGGVVRIVTPDLESEAKLLLREIQPAPDATIEAHRLAWLRGRCPLLPGERLTRAIVFNHGMWLDGHKFVYDFETLEQSISLAGFESISRESFGHSAHHDLRGIDRHDGGATGGQWLTSMALIVEATKAEVARLPEPGRATGPNANLSREPIEVDPLHREVASLTEQLAASQELGRWLQGRLIDAAAARCAANNWRRIALYGAGRHTRPIVRQPWKEHDVQVVAVLDDEPRASHLRGVPIVRPDDLPVDVNAIVISSDAHERAIFERATAMFGPRNIPMVRIYGDPPVWTADDDAMIARLTKNWGVAQADARWLMQNRFERHDASLPMLPPQRTELHLRRYEFAAARVGGLRVLDAACGTGYGSHMLRTLGGAAAVTGIDVDPEAIAYATRRHGTDGVTFTAVSATDTGLLDGSFDAIVSFETVEHIRNCEVLIDEFARLLPPGAPLLISTPNGAELTEHHVHSFTRPTFERLLRRRFEKIEWFGQCAEAPTATEEAAGILPLEECRDADFLITIACRKG